jgi:DNA invertase Pin-like site-specific DNA recombinase
MNQAYGYIRVSTKEQNEDRQFNALAEYGITKDRIYADKMSGKDFNRPEYRRLVHEVLDKGDLLVVKSIDRIGRNYKEILEEWRVITKEKGADIKILDMPLLDTRQNKDLLGTFVSDIVLQLLSFISEHEREVMRQRQSEGIAAARAKGKNLGRPHKLFPEPFSALYGKWRGKAITSKEAVAILGVSMKRFYYMSDKYRNMKYVWQSRK